MFTGKIGQLALAPFARIGAAKVIFIVPFFFFLQWHNLQSPWTGLFFTLIYFLLCICVDTCQPVLQSGVKSCLQTARVIIYKGFSHIRNKKERQGLSEEEEWVYKGLRQKKTWAPSLIIKVLFTHSHITCQFLSPHCSCSNCQPSIITTLNIHDADQIITNQLKTFVWCFWAPKHLCRWSWAISFNAPPPKTKEPLFSGSKQWMFVSEILTPHVWSSEWHSVGLCASPKRIKLTQQLRWVFNSITVIILCRFSNTAILVNK